MYFYQPGSSLTPKNTYSDNNLSIPNPNPVPLDDSGFLRYNVFFDGPYRIILKDKNGVQQWDRDSINSLTDISFGQWDGTINYGIGGTNIVYADNGIYYVSIATPNLGNDPATSPAFWMNAIDYFLASQTTIEPGHIAIGGDPDGLVGLDATAKGSLVVGEGDTVEAFPIGADDLYLQARASEPLGIRWAPAPGSVRDYTELLVSGNVAINPDADFVYVQLIGPGGGGSNITSLAPASGGGGGAYADGLFRVSDLTSSVAVSIGAGGTGGGTGSGLAGTDGGTTSFGAYLVAPGGKGGGSQAQGAWGGDAGGGEKGTGGVLTDGTTAALRSAKGNGGYSSGAGGAVAFESTGEYEANSAGAGGDCIKGGAGGGAAIGNSGAGGVSREGGNGGAGSIALGVKGGNGVVPGGGGGASSNDGGGGDGASGRARVWQW